MDKEVTTNADAQLMLQSAVYHIRRTHMNTQAWSLTLADDQAITILQRCSLSLQYGQPAEFHSLPQN